MISRRRSNRTASELAGIVGGFAVAAVCAVCAAVVWPADLAWGLLALGALAILAGGGFEFGVVFDDDDERPAAGQ